jgi:molybdopterin-containing oxidoreductase family iron-sulfur binding subunit
MSETFPLRVVRPTDIDVTRRRFLGLLGTTALGVASGCAQSPGEIVPYVTQPPEVVPGVPRHFATAMELDGYATGLIVESREGRPVKVEGNPEHPASLGAAGVFHQAAVLQLYDPDRPQFVRHGRAPATWPECAAAFALTELQRIGGRDGDGVYFLLEPTASPLVAALIGRIRQRLPRAHFHVYAPLATSFAADGATLAFGAPFEPILDLTHADLILTADCDLLGEGPFQLRYARQFADRRRVRTPDGTMNRLYAIEGVFTPTGTAADHRFMVRPGEVGAVLAALLREVRAGIPAATPDGDFDAALDRLAGRAGAEWTRAVARDLIAHRGRAIAAVGPRQPPIVHAIGAALNEALDAPGAGVSYVTPLLDRTHGLAGLMGALRGGAARVLVMIGGNPSYNAPADASFSTLVRQVPRTLYAGAHESETARDAQWFAPLAHFLESWGDARALDGTTSIVQPLVTPLHGGQSIVDLLAFFAGDIRPSYDIVRGFWLDRDRFDGDADAWRESLRHGVVPATAAAPPQQPRVRWPALAGAAASYQPPSNGPVEVAFVPDRSVHDGRFANNSWLQELPDPITKLTWDNAAYMSRRTLQAIGAEESEIVEIVANERRLRAPAFAVPGAADGLIVLPLGYGREGGERVARGVGVNAYAVWTTGQFATGASAQPAVEFGVHGWHAFAVTDVHWSLEGRPIVLEADLDRFRREPHFTAEHRGPVPALYGPPSHDGRQWGMTIDLTVCTGCSSCVVACQAENNVPVVGKLGVQERREMHWLRIDRYLGGSDAHPRLTMQPMLCQHCEDAPCEYVCPVNATVHSPDGLNEMVYNRCVGTRFCSNNCPYKVRRFNFLNYTQELPETVQMAMNPDVTVRARGVMEKCTFCVQRIRRADIEASLDGSDAPYAQLQTACQQACPTRAIVFGALSDPDAAVTRDAHADHGYRVLNELGTRPRITYLARLRNLNRAIDEERP